MRCFRDAIQPFGFVLLTTVTISGCAMNQTPAPPALLTTPTREWMPVIVTFRVRPTETDEQKAAAIVEGRTALLREVASVPYRIRRVYETIPAIALDVSADALRILMRSPQVVAIEDDTVNAPQESRRSAQ